MHIVPNWQSIVLVLSMLLVVVFGHINYPMNVTSNILVIDNNIGPEMFSVGLLPSH